MLNLVKIAVTGGISSGKSTVCRFFAECGAYVVSADQIVHRLLLPETDLGKDVILLLGKDIVREGKIDRGVIAKKVFSDTTLLKKLENRIHPEVQKEIETQYQNVSSSHYPLFVAEVPLLYESGQETFYDKVILVDADEKECKKRFVQSGQTENEFEKRNQRLLPMGEKKQRASFVIENNGKLDALRQSVQTIFNSLMGSL